MKTHKQQPAFQSYFVIAFAICLFALQGCATKNSHEVSASIGGKPITAGWTKIVRGANNRPLTAQSVGDGNNPKVGPKEPLTDLSVNASDDKSVDFKTLAAGLPNPYYGATTLDDLRKSNKMVLLVRDEKPGNKYHCLLSVITPAEFVSRTNCK